MDETKIHWGQLGIIVIGLLSLSLVTMLILKKGDETTNVLLSAFSVTTPSKQLTPLDPEALIYRNDEYHFLLGLPKSWSDYRVFELDVSEQGEKIVSMSLPVERYRTMLKDSRGFEKRGVFVAGVRVVMRDSVQKAREQCSQYTSSIEEYQRAMAERKTFVAANDQEQNMIDVCLYLYDPESKNQAIRSLYLGMSDTAYFFRVPLEAFDNGFTEVPGELKQEIEGVYQSFRQE